MRSALYCRLFALAALGALVVSAPAFAVSEPAGEKTRPVMYVKDGENFRPANPDEVAAAAPHDDHGGGGLDFTGIKRYDLGIYTLIVFGLLMFVLSKYAWPHIRAGLEAREKNIFAALDQAKQDRAEAEARLADARKQLNEAAKQVSEIMAEARRDAEALKVTETEKGEKESQAIIERAKRDAELKREGDIKEVQQLAVELAALIATKALRQQVTIDNQQKLLDESIAELNVNAGGHKA
jgi:F-type H+-transporting ATPase subunit b